MKRIRIYLLCFICMFAYTYSTAQSNMTLAQIAARLNQDCPQEGYSGLIRILGFSYKDRVFEARTEMNLGDMFQLSKAKVKPKEAKELAGLMLVNQAKTGFGIIFGKVIKAKASYRMVLTSMYESDKVSITFTSQELESLFSKYGNNSTYENNLCMQEKTTNLQAPAPQDEYTVIEKAELTSSSLIYNVTIDDKSLGISYMDSEQLEDYKKSIKYSLTLSPASNNVLKSCLNTNRTVTYIITLKFSHNQYKIVLTSKDINEIIKS